MHSSNKTFPHNLLKILHLHWQMMTEEMRQHIIHPQVLQCWFVMLTNWLFFLPFLSIVFVLLLLFMKKVQKNFSLPLMSDNSYRDCKSYCAENRMENMPFYNYIYLLFVRKQLWMSEMKLIRTCEIRGGTVINYFVLICIQWFWHLNVVHY